MRAGGLGIPGRKIKDAAARVGFAVAPRMRALAIERSKCRSLKFGLRRQPRALPARVRGRFRMADVHGPCERKIDRLEHPAPLPSTVAPLPEERMRRALARDPLPVVRGPPLAVRISAGVDKLQVLRVGDVVALNPKRADLRGMRGELVVPPEWNGVARYPERRAAGRNLDPPPERRRARRARTVRSRRALLLERKPMPHVEQGFLMHRLVLEDGKHRLGAIEQRMPRSIEVVAFERIDHQTIGFVREGVHDLTRRPTARPSRPPRPTRFVRVDPAREKRFEPFVDASPAERFLDERVEAERRQVPFVEHDRMAQRDRLAVVRVLGDDVEERTRTGAVAAIPGHDGGPIDRHPCILIRNGLKWASEIAHHVERRRA